MKSGDPRTKTQLQLTTNTTSYYWFQMDLGHEHRMLLGGQEEMSKKRMARATHFDDYVRQASSLMPSSTPKAGWIHFGSNCADVLRCAGEQEGTGKLWKGSKIIGWKLRGFHGMPWGLFWIVFETMVMNITEHHQLGCEWCGPRNSPRPKKPVRATYFAPIAPMSSTWGTRYGYHLGTPHIASPEITYNPPFSVGWIPILVYSVMTIFADFQFLLLQSTILGAPHICLSNPQFQLIKYLVKSTMFAPLQFIFAWLIWYNYRFG